MSDRQLLQVLEPECLHTVGLLRDKALWEKKSVRYNTKLNYTIAKWVWEHGREGGTGRAQVWEGGRAREGTRGRGGGCTPEPDE